MATLWDFLPGVNYLTCSAHEKMVNSATQSLRQEVMVSKKLKQLGTTFVVLGNVYLLIAVSFFVSGQSIFMWLHIIAGISCMRSGFQMRKMARESSDR